MKKKIWIIDLIAFIGFLLAMKPQITGYNLHEWLGLAVGFVCLVHLLQHMRWVKSVTRTFDRVKFKQRIRYFLDVMLATGFLTIILTGVVISSLLGLFLQNYFIWRSVHFASSYVTLTVLLVKIVLHWEWIKCTVKNAFARHDDRRECPTLTPEALSRRAFLKQAGVISLGVLAVAGGASLISKNMRNSSASLDSSANTQEAQVLAAQASPTPLPTQSTVDATTEGLQVLPTAVPQPSPTIIAQTGRVLCSHGCAYPGKCRKYQDNNSNGRCDLGEPIW